MTEAKSRRAVVAGGLAWLVFCGVVVAVRGVRWDETYEFAQVILGLVRHPEGHPLLPYVRNAYSLQVYGSAGALWATGSAIAVNGLRNFLFMCATVFPAYLLGSRLSGRAVYGHAAALLLLAGVHLELRSTYPQFVWPDIFSNGHIGTAWALLTVFCFGSQWFRFGCLLLGLMPCIHVGQIPPVLLAGGAVGLWMASKGQWRELGRAACFFGIGVAFCGLFWLAQRPFIVPATAAGAYGAAGDVDHIWRQFVFYHDIHRSWPPANGRIGLALLIAITGLMTYAGWKRREAPAPDTPAWAVVFTYAVSIGVLVWGTMAVHAAMGLNTPRFMLQWMPYRLLNHVPPLVVASCCGVLSREKRGGPLVLAVLAAAVVVPYTQAVWPESVYTRYLAPSAGLVFVLAGAAILHAALAVSSRYAFALAVVLVASTAATHQFGAAAMALGAVTGFAICLPQTGVRTRSDWKRELQIAAAVMLASAAVFLYQQLMQRQVLPVGGFERSVESYLEARGQKDAMLAGPPEQLLLQAKTNHPIITDMALPYMITYLPSIGPAVNKLYEDVYGLRLAEPEKADWQAVWEERPAEAWRMVGQRYGFRYVVAPAHVHLNLRKVLSTNAGALYAIE